jgi:hypothetical protein
MSRRAIEAADGRGRYAPVDDAPARGPRRGAEEDQYDDDPRARARRVVEESRARRAARYAADDEPVTPRSRRAARRYADEEEATPRSRRYADDDPGYDDVPRPRGSEARRTGAHSGEFRTGELRPGYDMTGEFRIDEPPAPRSRSARSAPEERPRSARSAPEDRPRSARSAPDDRPTTWTRRPTDSGRHSRSEFVDLAEPSDPWTGGSADDDMPTLVDMAARRTRRTPPDAAGRTASRGARRGRAIDDDEFADEGYFRRLRGEAQ